MKSLFFIFIICCSMTLQSNAQEEQLPYHQIPDYPESYSGNNVAARVLDGLGYRYYWGTKDLRSEDMDYKPSEDSRTIRETLDHIYGLSSVILNGTQNKVNGSNEKNQSFDELRKNTLQNIALASKQLKSDDEGAMNDYRIIFQRGEKTTEFPFWNMLNGPVADAIYHTGQVVAYRRASGNPIQKGVRMMTGKTAE